VARHHAGHSRRLGGGQDLGLDRRDFADFAQHDGLVLLGA